MSSIGRRGLRQTVGGAAAALVIIGAVVGCSGDDTSAGTGGQPDVRPVGWHQVTLPGGVTPGSLTQLGDRLLVSARDESASPAQLAPRLLVLDRGRWGSIPLHPSSYYAYQARFRSVITDGTHIYAYGDASGGAHFNPRWTTWSGTTAGLTEYPQNFETFGGWGAGGLTAMTFSAGQPVIVGSWTSEGPGLDIVEWTLHGHDWVRGTSTGTALANTEGALNVMRSVGDDADGTALAGAVTRLGGGQVSLDPVVWRSTGTDPTWARIDLPASADGQATGVQCAGDRCLAAGYVGSRLAAWTVQGQHADAVDDLPNLPVALDTVTLVGPVGASDSAILTVSGGRSVLLQQGTEGWVRRAGPPGTPTAWLASGGRAYVITSTADRSVLWVGDLTLPG